MPELPEVETVRSILEKNILNKTILDIDVRYENIIQNESKINFINKLKYSQQNRNYWHIIKFKLQ